VLRIFNALKNPSTWPDFEPANFGSSGQHTNHYTQVTRTTGIILTPCTSKLRAAAATIVSGFCTNVDVVFTSVNRKDINHRIF
jgi:hypothetical protein